MSDHSHFLTHALSPKPFAVILGANEIASAIAVYLHRNGCGVVLSHDPSPPVFKRGMSFHGALFGDHAAIDEISAERVETSLEVLSALSRANVVAITPLGLSDLLVLRRLDLIIDARLQGPAQRPDLRNLARFAIGLGPGFASGVNCDVALSAPSRRAAIPVGGDAREPRRLLERFVYADSRGLWQTAVDLGSRAFRGFVVGHVHGAPVSALIDGILVGVARDGSEVVEGDILAEVEPRTRQAIWTGMDKAGRSTASAVMRVIQDYVDRREKSNSAISQRSP
ncbi:Xanthine dehydrogenase [Methylocella tundrae]|uniref:Xanthine dehydrogenase n=1 Tax=Methylocella tundrae TaxID=227605 RepID=A0A8B6M1B4_METTU|nr:xanthine dehydrogenase [Methylocella tundrae]VTZ25183.1 Xanthine dehydrogenase [Methylocella tundrae]VTZ48514.1 Xanthine dehydrogenase [Methylocella tundrae]